MNAKMLEFYLGAIQFVIGDIDGTTTPSNRLSPAVARREKIGWRLAVTAWGLHKFTLFETIDKTRNRPANIEGLLPAAAEIPKNDANLTTTLRVRLKMDDAGADADAFLRGDPGDEQGCRPEFGTSWG